MAGRIKHMERSRRSHNKNHAAVFGNFHRHAYIVANAKEQRLTLGQKVSKALKPLTNALKKVID